MSEQNNYIIRIATSQEIEKRWDELDDNSPIYNEAKKEFINENNKNTRITYIGLLNNKIISDATVIIKKEGLLNEAKDYDSIIDNKRVFLCAVRTTKEYENKGYFSKLIKYIEKDLLDKGYEELSLSVDKNNKRNNEIYKHLGYTNYIKTEVKISKKMIIFDYYYKKIKC